ncbi:MAG: hypothetical protein RPR98_04020, partial [Bermanella sp.]
MATTTQQIQEIYVGLLGRAADADGLAYWLAEIDGNTLTIDQLRSNIVNEQAEYAADLGSKTRTQVVNELYERMFERSADTEALAYWVDGEGGGVDVDFLVFALSNGAAASDRLVMENKVEAATYYTANTAQVDYTSGGAEASISDVDATSASIDASKAAVDAGTLGGQTLALTTAADNLVGGAGNDTITGLSAVTAEAATDTLTAADTIDGGAGTDTLNITTTGNNTDVLHAALVSNVEIVNIRATAGTATLDASSAAGITNVNANTGAGAVTVTNLATGAAIGVIGNGTVTNGAVTYGYADATDAQTINISGGTKIATTVSSSTANSTTATINSTGAANAVGAVNLGTGTNTTSLTINATTDLTLALTADYAATAAGVITGAGDVVITAGSLATAAMLTVDASAATGAVNAGDVGTVLTT